MKKAFCLVLFTIFLFLQNGIASYSDKQNISFDNINEEQGLFHSYVLSIFQDSRGLIWIGTYGGLQVYDGYSFNRFNISIKKSNILSNHVVNVIYEDKNNNLWFGTECGLNKFNPKTGEVKSYFYEPTDPFSLSHNHIRTIYQDFDGLFWIGTYGGGLSCFDERTGKSKHYRADVKDPFALQSDLINTFFVDNRGLFWIGTENGGISIFDKTKNAFVRNIQKSPNGLNNNTINSIFQDANGTVWIGTWGGGLNKYDPANNKFSYFTHNQSNSSVSGNNVRSIIQTEKDFLWIGTFGEGLNLFDIRNESFKKIKTNFSSEDNTAQEMIWTQFRDNENNLWLGTFGRGIIKENALKNTFTYKNLKTDDGVKLGISSVIEDKYGKLWLGTVNKGLFVYDLANNTYKKQLISNINPTNINNLYCDSKNRIWIGTDIALYLVSSDRTRARVFTHNVFNSKSISEGSVNSILEDSRGNIWIGFYGMGINVIKNGELDKNDDDVIFSKYKSELRDPAAYLDFRIWQIFEDSKGTIWFGTAKDLAYYSPEDKIFNTYPIGVASSFYEDLQGNIWVGSIGNGLFKLDKNKRLQKRYTIENGLANADILTILPDKLGRLWLGTPNGITLFNPATEDFSNFDKNYGLQRFSISSNACKMLKSGQLVFAGNNGFNVFTPEKIELNLPKSPIVYTDIKLNNKSIAYENLLDSSYVILSSVAFLDTLVLDYKNKILTIDYAAANYSTPSSISYAYKLEGFNDDWVITGLNRSATFSNLGAGEYLFKVKMTYNNGKWVEGSHSMKIIVPPPFWNTVWFKVILVLLLMYLIYLLFNFRLNILNKKFEKEKLKKEREIIHLHNDKLNAELDFKNKELAQSTIHLIRKNEDIIEIKNLLNDIVEHTTPEGRKKMMALLKHIDQKLDDSSNWEYFEYNFNLIHNNFLKRFAEKYPDINQNDLKICAYIRMNLSTKEMGNLLNVSYRTIESTRYRIRKKINIDSDLTLNDYIMRF